MCVLLYVLYNTYVCLAGVPGVTMTINKLCMFINNIIVNTIYILVIIPQAWLFSYLNIISSLCLYCKYVKYKISFVGLMY